MRAPVRKVSRATISSDDECSVAPKTHRDHVLVAGTLFSTHRKCILKGIPEQDERLSYWRLFTSPAHRHLLVDWEGHARRVLAQFRASCGRYPGDPRLAELIHDLLLRSPEFRAWWPDHEVLGTLEGQKTLDHPQAGYLMFEHLTFQVVDAPDLTVNVYTPLDEADTPAKLSQLLSERASVSRGF